MNVKEFRELLAKYPDEMPVLNMRCSDYDSVVPEDISVVNAVPQSYGYMRSHPTMSDENKSKAVDCLLIAGN